jgi:hypothetical protein
MSSDPRAKALSALARFQVTETTVGDTLHRIAEITLEAIPTAAVAGVTMLGDDGRPTTAVFTDSLSPEIDEPSTAREEGRASTHGGSGGSFAFPASTRRRARIRRSRRRASNITC